MKRIALVPLAALLMGAGEPAAPAKPALSPGEIVAAAPAADWAAIARSDLMVMELAPLGAKPRRVVIQLMPAPFSQGWVGNIRKLVAARWYDGVSVNRVQDNYVVQWGDANADDGAALSDADFEKIVADRVRAYEQAHPSAGKEAIDLAMRQARQAVMNQQIAGVTPSRAKRLPDGLAVVGENDYVLDLPGSEILEKTRKHKGEATQYTLFTQDVPRSLKVFFALAFGPAPQGWFKSGWPINVGVKPIEKNDRESFPGPMDVAWPVHCYGMVGVGRGMPPDTGTGAELYTVIGHAPRHLDRNIALVGRVIEGMEHLSSLPRGPGAMGFYGKAEDRVPILSVRMGNDVEGLPRYQYLSTESASFAAYADARANRRDPFFIHPAGGADICNIPVPVRRVP